MPVCGDCGGTVLEFNDAAGNGVCVICGTVVEENTIVSEVTFGEASSGAAIVQGSYVGQGSTHARMGGPFGSRGASESREQTIANASRKIRNIANALHLSEVVSAAATRLYTLAVELKFTKGRKHTNVVAVCLYISCRQRETRNYMLIDFSDLLQVNVFELGHTYLQLVHALNLHLPLVDPSHYISRFAALLEFGDETHKVAADAVRLVARMDRDWITRGRRPAGICGACLLLAARMNNFRRSLEEIVQVVKIADTTLVKRLEEFRKTPSGQLTLEEFRTVSLEEEMDPPAYTKGKEREARDAARVNVEEVDGEEAEKKRKRKGKKKRKRDEREDTTDVERDGPVAGPSHHRDAIDPRLLNEGILEGTVPGALFLPLPDETTTAAPLANGNNIDPALLSQPQPSPTLVGSTTSNGAAAPNGIAEPTQASQTQPPAQSEAAPGTQPHPPDQLDDATTTVLAEDIRLFLESQQGAQVAEALDDAEARRRAYIEPADELLGLDEDELDRFILSEEEVKMKERVWVEMNRDYLQAIAAKAAQEDKSECANRSRKRRKPPAKPRDASTPHGSTAAESVKRLLTKNPKFSKRINYDALNNLLSNTPGRAAESREATVNLDEKEDYMYRIEDKSDGEGMVVVEEGGGGVGMAPTRGEGVPARAKSAGATSSRAAVTEDELGEEDAEGDDDVDVSEKGDEYTWEEGYEQEV